MMTSKIRGGGTTPNSDLNAERRSDSGDKNGVC